MTRRPEPPTHATGAHRAPRGARRAAQPPVVENPAADTPVTQSASPYGTAPRSASSDARTTELPAPDATRETEVISETEGGDEGQDDQDGEDQVGEGQDLDETVPRLPLARYEPHLDGVFTYCLSVLCDHDTAVAALGEVLAHAERRADRAPAAGEVLRPWLYALARWECLRRLAEPAAARTAAAAGPAETADPRHRAELALLAWPEAAGTTAEQREALELAVRHQLAPHEVAAVLRMECDAARALLSSAACEVERTRTALAVVESGRCPLVARFTEDREVLLGAVLRRELVRHVDECAVCRRTAERATAGEPWPGTAASSAPLPVLRAPRAAAHAATLRALGRRPQRRRAAARVTPRFDRSGFPVAPKDRTARRSRLRSRAVTATVVATVVAAPVLALWAAYRGAPLGEGHGSATVSAPETDSLGGHPHEGSYDDPYDSGAYDPYTGSYEAGGAARAPMGAPATVGHRFADVSVAVVGPDGRPVPLPAGPGATPPPAPRQGPPGPVLGPGRLTVEAQPSGTATVITLRASGGEPVSWSMSADAPWLRLSQPGGVLRPGQSVTVTVSVDHSLEPSGRWRARVAVAPGGSAVTIEGCGSAPAPTGPTPGAPTPPATPPAPTPMPTRTG